MTVAQLTERETLYRRIQDLPVESIERLSQYLDDLEAYEPNEETVAAILEGDELARAYCSRFVEK
jgi:predicted PP-loop superfamily ATPase